MLLTAGLARCDHEKPMLLKQSAVYAVSRGVAAVFALGAIAVFSRILTPAEYGDYVLLLAAGMLINVIGFQWVRVSALRFIPRYPDQTNVVLRSLLAAFAGVAIAVVGIGLALLPVVAAPVVATAVVFALATGWFELEQDIMRIKMAPWSYGKLTVARAVLGLVFGFALVQLGADGYGPVLGLAAAMVVASVWFARTKWWSAGGPVSKPFLRRFLRYGAPLVVAYALEFVVSTSDRFLLLWLSTKEATGLYSAGYDLAFRTVSFAAVVVGLAALPLAILRLEEEGPQSARAQLGKNRDALLAVTLPVVIVVAVFADNIGTSMLGADFSDTAGTIIPIVAVSAGALALKAYFADHAIHLDGRTRLLALVTGGAALINVVLNLLLIPDHGETGAAVATLLAYSAGLAGALWVAHRRFGLPPLSRDAVRVVIAGAILVAAAWPLRGADGVIPLVGQVAFGGLVYGTVLLALDFADLRSRLAQFVRLRR